MLSRLRDWLGNKPVDAPDDVRYLSVERVSTGKTPEEKLAFWTALHNWLSAPEGRVYVSMMAKESERIQKMLLTEPDRGSYPELVAQLRQQDFVIGFPGHVQDKVKRYQRETKTI